MGIYSDAIIRKVSDGDFETVMKSVNFSTTPREVVTINDMERHYYKAVQAGTESRIYG